MDTMDSIPFTLIPPQDLPGEQLILLQSHLFLTTGNININIGNV